ncbi:hypothetical protein C0Q70_17954 [Pomacea canaliculata]|uniref:Uncharacterized protein n=1 Tax=Pomacea canaliculata TaxID=400727 RepID=A0A2T7NLV3_POMCA|nr:hypothetical protein C0Q70_17954 [Pomacea canaliculata]
MVAKENNWVKQLMFTTDLTDHDPVQDEVTMKCSGLLTCHPLEPDTLAMRVPGFVRRPQCADKMCHWSTLDLRCSVDVVRDNVAVNVERDVDVDKQKSSLSKYFFKGSVVAHVAHP